MNLGSSWRTNTVGFGALIAAIGTAVANHFDDDPNTVADWGLVVGLAVTAIGFFVARDNKVTSEDVKAREVGNGPKTHGGVWLLLIASLPAFLLAMPGCTTGGATSVTPLDVSNANIPHAQTLVQGPSDDGTGGTLTSNAPNPQHYATFGTDGMEIFSPLPAGSAFIGQSGAALSDPKDQSVDSVEMEFDVFWREGMEAPIVYAKHVKAAGINGTLSEPIRANAETWQHWVDGLKKLAETDQAKFEAAMLTIREVSPSIADMLMRAITGGGG